MIYVLNILILIVGFVFLVKGADFFVDNSSAIAKKFHISPLVIGLTLVAFGTSLPELAVSFIASLTVEPGATADIAMGNVIGSNLANIALILGLTAIVKPVVVSKSMYFKEFLFLITSSILLIVFAFLFQSDHQIVWWEALILLIIFMYYIWVMIKSSNETQEPSLVKDEVIDKEVNMKKSLLFVLVGLIGVTLGGYMVTYGAQEIAVGVLVDLFNVELTKAITLIGLTVVAVGTSLPEMVTSVVAAKKGENDIAFGNLVGSNLFNILFILGLSGVVTTLGINQDVLIDIWILLGVTIIVLVFAITGKKVSKNEGIILITVYIAYITYIILRAFNLM